MTYPGGPGMESGAEGDEDFRAMTGTDGQPDAVYEPGGGLSELGPVNVEDVNPDLANPEMVAEMVASQRDIQTDVGGALLADARRHHEIRWARFALDSVEIRDQARRDPGVDRAEQRGQDHVFQRNDRGLQADQRNCVDYDGAPLGNLKRNRIARRASPGPSRTSGCSPR